MNFLTFLGGLACGVFLAIVAGIVLLAKDERRDDE
jgi:hypothetical protein